MRKRRISDRDGSQSFRRCCELDRSALPRRQKEDRINRKHWGGERHSSAPDCHCAHTHTHTSTVSLV